MNVLVLGAGGPAGVNFIKSLLLTTKVDKIIGTETNKYHQYLVDRFVDKVYTVPKCTEDGYVDVINEIIEENDIDFVHAQPDVEVRNLAIRRDKIKAKTFLPSTEAILLCQDKFESAKIWADQGLCDEPLEIETRENLTKQEIKHALEKYGKIWLRAKEGAGGKGSTPVDNIETGYHWIRYWRSKDWEKNRSWDQWEWMAQKYYPGRNIAWHSLWKNGELIVSQGRERLEYIYPNLAPSGITGTPVVQKTIHDEVVNWIGKTSVLALDKKPNGIYCVDLKETELGDPMPTEINAGRFFTTSFFFSNAGYLLDIERANMPYIYLLLGMDKEFPKGSAFNILPKNLYWIRHIDCGEKLLWNENLLDQV